MLRAKNKLLAVLVTAVLILIIIYPDKALSSAQKSLSLWMNIVLPSLFPYMAGTSILYYMGGAARIITLCDRMIKGSGAALYSVSMGWLSGTPAGAKILSELKTARLVTDSQQQALLTAVSCAGPVFMLGSVAGGMLGDVRCGVYIMLPNYIGAMIAFAVVYFTNSREKYTRESHFRPETLPFAQALEKSVVSGMSSMIKVCGYILLCGVLASLLEEIGLIGLLSAALRPVFLLLGIEPALAPAFLKGLLEITNGCEAASAAPAAITSKIALCSGLAAWNGLSVLYQNLSFVKNISAAKYIISKAIHAGAAYCLCLFMLLLFPISQ